MQSLRKYHSRYLVWIAILFFGITSAHAQNGGQVRALAVLDGSLHQIRPDSSVTVEDSIFFDAGNAGKLDSSYGVQDQVTLMINEASTLYLRTTFNVTVKLLISYTDAKGDTASVTRNFTVGYDSAHTYNSRSSFVFNGAHKVTLKVLSDSSNVTTWDPTSVLLVEDQLTTTPVFVFNCSQTVTNITINPSGDPSADELPVSWNVVQGANQYDLEWTWVDSSALADPTRYGAPPYDPTLIFRNNSTRITTTGTSYKIPIIYENTGTVFIRVRPVQTGSGYAVTNAIWSSDASPVVMGQYTFRGHERQLNWQSSVVFAEEGKRKVAVQYFDGSLRSRQSVTKDNTTNTTIVAETYYDYQGRPAIQVMPAPTLNTIIKYTAAFNVGPNSAPYSQSNFDTLANPADFCSIHADSMINDSGASRYYSPRNPIANIGLNQFIPNAHDYPFTETEYMPDNTGRIKRRSAVGPDFQLGSGHEIKYVYGTPDQNELDALFGTEVGDKSHYFKNMLRDANGQYNVSYIDMHGRTIATALAGVQPAGMSPLASNNRQTITETLADSNSVFFRGQSMVSQKSLIVPMADTFQFHYSLLPDVYSLANCQSQSVCYTCRYDLNITITDNCNNQLLGGQPYTINRQNFSLASLGNSCVDTATNLSFSLVLPEGSYTVTKTLTVDPDAFNFYRDSIFLPNNTCTTIGQFITQQKAAAQSANSTCAPSCAACESSVGTFPTFLANYNQAIGLQPADTTYATEANAAYQTALSACSSLCQTTTAADDIRNAMLQDMTPPYGQYADTSKAPNADIYSIYYTPDTNDFVPVYQLPAIVYLDENSRPDSVYNIQSGLTVDPKTLTPAQFAQNFRPSWAAALLPYHPEYCKLLVMQAYNSSLLYDRKMETINSYQEALDSGFLNPLGDPAIASQFPIDSYNIDPLNATLGSQLTARLQNFQKLSNPNMTLNLWELASVTVKCDSGSSSCVQSYNTTAATFASSWCPGDLDMAWRNFRELYLGAKQEIFYQNLLSDQAMQKSGVCSPVNPNYKTEPKLSSLYSTHHQPEFSDVGDAMNADPTMKSYFSTSPNPTQASNQKAQAQASIDSFYTSVCNAYAHQWMQQLSACTAYNPSDVQNIIIPGLTALCRQACDSAHPYGASSLPPGQTITVEGMSCTSFQDIINHYNHLHNITDATHCNAEVINAPLPYGSQAAYSAKPVYSRPTDCECAKITDLYNNYAATGSSDASFAAWLLRTHQIIMADSDLTTLRNMCKFAAGTATCTYLSNPINLPPAMQCNTGETCSRCQTIDSLYSVYQQQYPTQLPSDSSNTDTAQSQKNVLFQNFMNNRLGYNLQTWQYLQFMDTCAAHSDQTGITTSCLPQLIAQTFTSGGTDNMADIASTPDGGYALAGYKTVSGVTNAYLLRYNSTGDVLWAKTYSSVGGSLFTKVKLTPDGGFIAVGVAYYSPANTTGKALVIKTDAAGNTEWEKTYSFTDGSNGEILYDVIQTSDGGFAIAGDHNLTQAHFGPAAMLCMKLDASGNLLWSEGITGDPGYGGTDGYSVVESSDTLIFIGRQWGPVNGSVRGVLMKVQERTGNLLNAISILDNSNSSEGAPFGLQAFHIGLTNKGYHLSSYVSEFGQGWDGRLGYVDLGFNGTVLKSSRVSLPPNTPSNETPNSANIIPMPDGGYLAGQTTPFSPNIFWTRFDSAGNLAWSHQSALPGTQTAGSVIQNPNGTYTGLGTNNGAAMILDLSSTGAAGCLDAAVTINLETPNIQIVSLADAVSGLTTTGTTTPLTETTQTNSVTATTCPVGNCYINYNGPLLCGNASPVMPPVKVDSTTACTDSTFFGTTAGTALYNTYSDSLTGAFEANYLNTCMQAYKHESFTVTHTESEYHFTLSYYDQAGNLLKTVPPAGVRQNTDSTWLSQVRAARAAGQVLVPNHTLVSSFRYNTLNKVVSQHSPDAGSGYFWYDRLGRMALAQNNRQIPGNQYTYTLYDSIGRAIQIGQLTSGMAIADTITRNDSALQAWMNQALPTADQITVTTYDSGAYAIVPQLVQRNLRNRISWSALFDTATQLANGSPNAAAATYFTYDILGNVDTLIHDFGGGVLYGDVANSMNQTNNRFKKVSYNFDLVSGKINQVSYQHGYADAFYHTYLYDAENRITNVQSSVDSIHWDNDAFYNYYADGNLARTVLGEQQVQGINHAYTLQGWPKAINPAPYTGGTFTLRPDSSGTVVANTAYNLLLDYFNGDYDPISNVAGPDSAVNVALGSDYRPLYNGNISSIGARIRGLNMPLLYNYQYDQLNRLIHMDAWNRTGDTWNAITKIPDFQENIAYDPNGNIQHYKRNGNSAISLAMDSLNYFYVPGTNKLDHIVDSVPSSCSGCNDLTTQAAGNYQYDSVGELTADASAGIANITWTIYGKIASISKPAHDSTIYFTYDASGRRISKSIVHAGDTLTTWYVRDAGGHILSVYTYGDPTINGKDLTQTELDIYGSSRLGTWKRNVDVQIKNPSDSVAIPLLGYGDSLIFMRGNKLFELTNHLGNVLSTISDKRYGVSTDDSTVTYFNPDVVSANDYYPFGMLQPGRQYAESSLGSYRYGFNGREQDNEVKGIGNQIDFGDRIYDPRVGRWLSTDPFAVKSPSQSPYGYGLNNPISFVDIGGDTVIVHVSAKRVGTAEINLYSRSENDADKTGKRKLAVRDVPVYEVTLKDEKGSTATFYYTRIAYRADPGTGNVREVTFDVNADGDKFLGVIKKRYDIGKPKEHVQEVLELRDINTNDQEIKGTIGVVASTRKAIQMHLKGASDGCLLCVGSEQFKSKDKGVTIVTTDLDINSDLSQQNFIQTIKDMQKEDKDDGKSDVIILVFDKVYPKGSPAAATPPPVPPVSHKPVDPPKVMKPIPSNDVDLIKYLLKFEMHVPRAVWDEQPDHPAGQQQKAN